MRYLTTIPLKLKTSSGVINLKSGDTFKPKSEDAIRPLREEGKVRPVSEAIAEKYRELTGWLHNHDLTGDEIKETLPNIYETIQKAIEDMDSAFYAEDLTTFQDSLDKVRLLYTEAIKNSKVEEVKRKRQ